MTGDDILETCARPAVQAGIGWHCRERSISGVAGALEREGGSVPLSVMGRPWRLAGTFVSPGLWLLSGTRL